MALMGEMTHWFVQQPIQTDLEENVRALRVFLKKRNPRKRIGSPEDVAGLTIFLCSRAGAYVVGETIASDGGIFKTGGHNLG